MTSAGTARNAAHWKAITGLQMRALYAGFLRMPLKYRMNNATLTRIVQPICSALTTAAYLMHGIPIAIRIQTVLQIIFVTITSVLQDNN
jgi:hypothetical protein